MSEPEDRSRFVLPGTERHANPKWKHRVTMIAMSAGLDALIREMDRLSDEGWSPFHMHEAMAGGEAKFLVFSRRLL